MFILFSDFKRNEYRKLRNGLRVQLLEWRNKVLTRDDNKCVKCGSTERLEAHHIKPFIFYPKHRLRVSNGKTLCKSCHSKIINHGFNSINHPKYDDYINSLIKRYVDEGYDFFFEYHTE